MLLFLVVGRGLQLNLRETHREVARHAARNIENCPVRHARPGGNIKMIARRPELSSAWEFLLENRQITLAVARSQQLHRATCAEPPRCICFAAGKLPDRGP